MFQRSSHQLLHSFDKEDSLVFDSLPISINTNKLRCIHKRVPLDYLDKKRPMACQTSIQKIFAFSLSKIISPFIDKLISKDEKGFIKVKVTLDGVLNIWEGSDMLMIFF